MAAGLLAFSVRLVVAAWPVHLFTEGLALLAVDQPHLAGHVAA